MPRPCESMVLAAGRFTGGSHPRYLSLYAQAAETWFAHSGMCVVGIAQLKRASGQSRVWAGR